MLLIKVSGLILVMLSSVMFGFLKSKSLVLRSKKLFLILEGTDMLYEHIEQEGCELYQAVEKSFFQCDFLSFGNNSFSFCEDYLKSDEAQEIKAFFASLGSSVKKAECDRIINFKLKIKKFYEMAEKDALQKCKIYQTFGICIGLALGILLI